MRIISILVTLKYNWCNKRMAFRESDIDYRVYHIVHCIGAFLQWILSNIIEFSQLELLNYFIQFFVG